LPLSASNSSIVADVVEELIARLSTPSGIKRSLKIPHLNLVTPIRQENLIRLVEGSDRFKFARQISVLTWIKATTSTAFFCKAEPARVQFPG
jgi:hypothetical protein